MKKVFEKTTIKNLELKNRFMRSALWMNDSTEDGHLTDSLTKTYVDLAKGGAGLIFTGYAFISDDEQPNPKMLGISNDGYIEEYKEFTKKIHDEGSKIALQIALGGSQSHHPDAKNMNILAPSAIENRVTKLMPKAVTKEDIKTIVTKFGKAAKRAKDSGFDAVEVHGAHGYFLSSFLTPYYNRRTDEYNGTIHDRARIIYEVYEEIRKEVGEDYPVIFKLNFSDFMDEDEGLVEEDAVEVFKRLDEMGVDMFHVSGTNESSGKGLMPARTKIIPLDKQSYFKEATKKIAEQVEAPVILMGGNRNIDLMEEILNTSDIEYVSLARPLLSEPDLINKWENDKNHRPKCVSCNKCWETKPNTCIFNR